MAKSDFGNGWRIALAVGLIGAIATVTAALITSAGDNAEQDDTPGATMPSAPNTCLGPQAANVSAFLTDDDVNFAIHISCTPPADSQYVLIAQPRGVDVDPENPHPEYYPIWGMGQPAVGSYQRTFIDPYIQAGAEVTYYVVSVDDAGFAQLQAQESTRSFVLNLPESHTVVSNRETLKR